LSSLFIHQCGIYTETAPLNPPFSLSVDAENLKFSGLNDEDYFIGYNIYYKENPEDFYKVCDNDLVENYPTIPASSSDAVNPYTVNANEIFPQESVRSFYDLYYNFDGPVFYFAVSAVGDEDQESERIEFGAWPTPAVQ
jgi:hypothetical protein